MVLTSDLKDSFVGFFFPQKFLLDSGNFFIQQIVFCVYLKHNSGKGNFPPAERPWTKDLGSPLFLKPHWFQEWESCFRRKVPIPFSWEFSASVEISRVVEISSVEISDRFGNFDNRNFWLIPEISFTRKSGLVLVFEQLCKFFLDLQEV